jgi:hypothetical protein
MLGMHPEGHGSTDNQLVMGFGPDMPDYAGIAVDATGGWAWGKRIVVEEWWCTKYCRVCKI